MFSVYWPHRKLELTIAEGNFGAWFCLLDHEVWSYGTKTLQHKINC